MYQDVRRRQAVSRAEIAKEAILEILRAQVACTFNELSDRCYEKYKIGFGDVSEALTLLTGEEKIDKKTARSPYNMSYSFYFLLHIEPDLLNRVIEKKAGIHDRHRTYTKKIGDFGQILVERCLKELGYMEVEVKKEKHQEIGIARAEIDVFGLHPRGFYQGIEVKNRRQPLTFPDLREHLYRVREARVQWKMDIKPAFVVRVAHKGVFNTLKRMKIPTVYTRVQYVPAEEELVDFYTNHYIPLTGSNYIQLVPPEDIPKELLTAVTKYILRN